MITDYSHDTSLQKLHALRKQFIGDALPPYVKLASGVIEAPAANIALSLYGDPSRRTFPCHTKQATWLSCLYLLGQSANQEQWDSPCPQARVEQRLMKAAKYWGILPDVRDLKSTIEKQSAFKTRELNDDDFALAVHYGAERVRRFPIVNAASVEKAASSLYRSRVSYPYAWRKKAAMRVLERAIRFGVRPEKSAFDWLVKASGAYPAEPKFIAARLLERAVLFPPDVRNRMRKAAHKIYERPGVNVETLCTILDDIDRHFKKYAMYNAGLPMPEDVCFNGVEEKLSPKEATVSLTTGKTFKLSEVKAAGVRPLEVIDPAYAAAVSEDGKTVQAEKLATLLPTIPKDDAAALEAALRAVGVSPVAAEKSARLSEDAFSREALQRVFGTAESDGLFSMTIRPASAKPAREVKRGPLDPA